MTTYEAIQKAQELGERTGRTYIVVHRTDHPHLGPWTYVIEQAAKHAWLPTETLIATVNP